MRKSIIMNLDIKKCYICQAEGIVEAHHCIHGARRRLADEDGLIVNLCVRHHRLLHDKGIGDKALMKEAEEAYLRYNMVDEDEFIGRYGKSWL